MYDFLTSGAMFRTIYIDNFFFACRSEITFRTWNTWSGLRRIRK